jgi:hypothetical protein
MKLNLVPTTVNREGRSRAAVFVAIVAAAAGVAGMVFMKSKSEGFVTAQNKRIEDATPIAQRAVTYVEAANKLIDDNKGLILNAELAASMAKQCDKYPDLFNDLKPYIPGFFRVTAMSATPNGDSTQINLSGVIKTQQQYADLMLALLRFPDVVSVGRTGFNFQNNTVPALTPQDQAGRIQKPGDPTWPDDPLDRLDAEIARARSTGFQNQGNFGTTNEPIVRGAMPDWSAINVALIVKRDLQAPDPLTAVKSTQSMWPKVDLTSATGGATGSTGTTGTGGANPTGTPKPTNVQPAGGNPKSANNPGTGN